MELQLGWDGDDRLDLTCSGEIGWDAAELLSRRISEALEGRPKPQVLMDIEDVDFITSAGIGALLQLRKCVSDRGGRIVIACASPMIAQLFTTVGLDRYMPLAASVEAGRRLLTQTGAVITANQAS